MTDQEKRPEVKGQVADAVPQNWVDRHAPPWLRPYLCLSRADRPIGTWLLFIPCLWGLFLAAMATSDLRLGQMLWIILVCGAGSFLMRGAGCTWNDITDRHIDAKVARTRSRPIPSGQVSVFAALLWMALQCLISLGLLCTLNTPAIILAICALVPVAIYPFAKRFTWWPQLFLGIAFNWGVLVGWTAYFGTLSLSAILLYIAAIVWTLFYDTIYAHQDIEDDALIGVRSTARLFGENTPLWLNRFSILSSAFVAMPIALRLQENSFLVVLIAMTGALAFFAHLRWQLSKLNIRDPQNCMVLFRSNRDAGLLLLLGLVAGAIL